VTGGLVVLPLPEAVRRTTQFADGLFCSELVIHSYRRADLRLGSGPAYSFRPADVLKAEELELVGFYLPGQPLVAV
jgi:hypothetical protein